MTESCSVFMWATVSGGLSYILVIICCLSSPAVIPALTRDLCFVHIDTPGFNWLAIQKTELLQGIGSPRRQRPNMDQCLELQSNIVDVMMYDFKKILASISATVKDPRGFQEKL